MDAKTAAAGDWVQIHQIILPPGERAAQVPDDTQDVPFEAWLKGFLIDDEAEIGAEVAIRTLTGRRVGGTLMAIHPAYPHGFGEPVPELLTIGGELRAILTGGDEA